MRPGVQIGPDMPAWAGHLISFTLFFLTLTAVTTPFRLLRDPEFTVDERWFRTTALAYLLTLVLLAVALAVIGLVLTTGLVLRYARLHRTHEAAIEAQRRETNDLMLHLPWRQGHLVLTIFGLLPWAMFSGRVHFVTRRWWLPEAVSSPQSGDLVRKERQVPRDWSLLVEGDVVLVPRDGGWTAYDFPSLTADFELLPKPVRLHKPIHDLPPNEWHPDLHQNRRPSEA